MSVCCVLYALDTVCKQQQYTYILDCCMVHDRDSVPSHGVFKMELITNVFLIWDINCHTHTLE